MMGRCSDAVNDYIKLEGLAPGGTFEVSRVVKYLTIVIEDSSCYILSKHWLKGKFLVLMEVSGEIYQF